VGNSILRTIHKDSTNYIIVPFDGPEITVEEIHGAPPGVNSYGEVYKLDVYSAQRITIQWRRYLQTERPFADGSCRYTRVEE
jgi:hypothetical protein